MIFTVVISVRGNLLASYVFEDDNKAEAWLSKEFKELQAEHGPLTYTKGTLDGLKVGDRCFVWGDGDEEYVIEKLIKYSPHRYGFVLDSGCSEEVAKCYTSVNIY